MIRECASRVEYFGDEVVLFTSFRRDITPKRDAQLQQYTADFAAERRVHSQESADAGGCDKCSENLAALNRSLSECKSNTNGRGTKTLPLTSLWGTSWESNKTGGFIETTVLSMGCSLPSSVLSSSKSDMKVCCALTTPSLKTDRPIGVGLSNEDMTAVSESSTYVHGTACKLDKKYTSSPYELEQFDFATQLASKTQNQTARLEMLLAKITSKEEYYNSINWLQRVKLHMQSEKVPEYNESDQKYLSKWEVTKTCGEKVDKWVEWIEPLIVQSRHPFAYRRCRHSSPIYWDIKRAYSTFPTDAPNVGFNNVDYILLKSGLDVYRSISGKDKIKHFMLDAGSSTFDSSLWWFICAYSQRKVNFDSVYAWELTPLMPTKYWEAIPSHLKPYWHFYNSPVKSSKNHPDSPFTYIRQISSESDFVSMKLDIDSPSTEIPLFEQLISDEDSVFSLIDEFFFELHYRCEVMGPCGWGEKIPQKYGSLQLDRLHTLEAFRRLREKGIRAHFWP